MLLENNLNHKGTKDTKKEISRKGAKLAEFGWFVPRAPSALLGVGQTSRTLCVFARKICVHLCESVAISLRVLCAFVVNH